MDQVMTPQLVVLNSGHKMPLIGLGTSAIPLPPLEDLTSIFVNAIEIGYRHFDTAAAYGSEQAVGLAVSKAIELGLINSRQDVFITSKLWCTHAHPQLVLPALSNTLQRLGLEYVDLYLIHWPLSFKPDVDGYNFTAEDILPLDMQGTWKAMEECCKLGLAKSIGVSNFSTIKLSQILQYSAIPPAVNQVELNVTWQQMKLLKFCKEKGIHVSAWSPLGSYGVLYGSNTVIESPIIKEIAIAKGKTAAQVALRWIHEQGVSAIVKSFNKERMKQNLEIFDWEIGDEEVQKIERIPQRRGLAGEMFLSKNGPLKTVYELWDGEI